MSTHQNTETSQSTEREPVRTKITVYFKTVDGRIRAFQDLHPNLSIAEFKRLIEVREGQPFTSDHRLQLVYAGKRLEDDRTLADYYIRHETTVHSYVRLAGD
jgi:large subunit ribosomal protein L40e/ubiquitin C